MGRFSWRAGFPVGKPLPPQFSMIPRPIRGHQPVRWLRRAVITPPRCFLMARSLSLLATRMSSTLLCSAPPSCTTQRLAPGLPQRRRWSHYRGRVPCGCTMAISSSLAWWNSPTTGLSLLGTSQRSTIPLRVSGPQRKPQQKEGCGRSNGSCYPAAEFSLLTALAASRSLTQPRAPGPERLDQDNRAGKQVSPCSPTATSSWRADVATRTQRHARCTAQPLTLGTSRPR